MTTTSTDSFLRAALDEDGAFCAAGRVSRKSVEDQSKPAASLSEVPVGKTVPAWPAECHEPPANADDSNIESEEGDRTAERISKNL
jgi:hypothetical protein